MANTIRNVNDSSWSWQQNRHADFKASEIRDFQGDLYGYKPLARHRAAKLLSAWDDKYPSALSEIPRTTTKAKLPKLVWTSPDYPFASLYGTEKDASKYLDYSWTPAERPCPRPLANQIRLVKRREFCIFTSDPNDAIIVLRLKQWQLNRLTAGLTHDCKNWVLN
jgi:hypothetical protein